MPISNTQKRYIREIKETVNKVTTLYAVWQMQKLGISMENFNGLLQ
jgi:hypothetical protein